MFSRIALWLVTILLLYTSLVYYPRWKQEGTERVIAWDVAGYYWYIPSIFIYHDLKHQAFKDSILKKYQPTPEFQEGYLDSTSNNWVMKYSSGTAVGMLPAFLVANSIATVKDGFSTPYQLAIQIEWLLFAFLGLFLLRKFLLYYFSDKVVAFTLLLLVFGTNYLNWAAIDVGQTHSLLFTIYAVLLLQTRSFYISPSKVRGFFIGLTIGYMVLIRPTEIVSALIPLLWDKECPLRRGLAKHISFIGKYYLSYIFAIIGCLVAVLPQLIYWKYVTDHWVVYSYQDQGFSFLHPHLKAYTFDWVHGWLIHSPGMAIAIIGIIPFIRKGDNRFALVLFAIINYYIVISWDVWTYGSRAMVQSYPILSVFIASFLSWSLQVKWRMAVATLLIFFSVYYNFWWTYVSHPGQLYPGGKRQSLGILDSDQMTGRYYKRIVGTWSVPRSDLRKLNEVRRIFEGIPREVKQLYRSDIILHVDTSHEFSKELKAPLTNINSKWIRIYGRFRTENKEWNYWKMRQFSVRTYLKARKKDDQELRIDRFIKGGGVSVQYIDLMLQKPYPDSLGIQLWNAGSTLTMDLDSISVFSFDQ